MKPLEGLKVIELGMYATAPSVTRLLCDWGAEVIKVESPTGDNTRYSGAQSRLPTQPDCSLLFSIMNSGKKLVSLNLKTPDGMEIMEKLLADADIFVSNTRYGGLTRLGLDYESLHQRHPRLVCCYISGYGFEGAEKDKPGFDLTSFWARTGILNALRDPGCVPRFPPPGIGDLSTANVAAAGILAAIYQRSVTGEGMQVKTSLMATGIWCNYNHITSGQDRPPTDPLEPIRSPEDFKKWRNPFYHIYKCKDERLFFLLGGAYSKLHTTLQALGLGDLAEDPKYKNHAAMQKNSGELYDIMIEVFAQKTSAEWAKMMSEMDIPYEILAENTELSKDPQAWENGFLTHLHCPNGSTYVVPNTPVEFSGVPRELPTHPGTIGCDTREILTSLGYTPQQIEDLLQRQVAVIA